MGKIKQTIDGYSFGCFKVYLLVSVTQSCPILGHPTDCSTPGLPVHHHLPEFAQTHVHQVSDAIQPSHPLSSPSPPAPNPSQHQSLFQWVGSLHQVAKVVELQLQHWWPKYISFSIRPSSEYSGLISFRMNWLDLLAVQGTLKHHNVNASILWRSAFFIVQLSHVYMTTGKSLALTRWTSVSKGMSLLSNMLSRLATPLKYSCLENPADGGAW